MTAIPAVKPVTTGCGMNLMICPNLTSPATIRMAPAIKVARTRPS